MNLDRIRQNLETLFTEDRRWPGATPRVVFWNDRDSEFEAAFETLSLNQLPALSKQVLTPHNAWQIKQFLHGLGSDDAVLIYQAGLAPDPREDWLYDARLYGQAFSAQGSEMLQQELGFTHPEIQAFIAQHGAFFKSQDRRSRLLAFEPAADSSPEQLGVYLMAVVLNLKSAAADMILQTVLQAGLDPEQNGAWQDLLKFFGAEPFFLLCQQSLRLKELPSELTQVFRAIFVTHFGHQFGAPLPLQWRSLQIQPSNACFRFADHWIHDTRVRALWFALADDLAEELGLAGLLDSSPPEHYVHCDGFALIDKQLICHLRDRLLDQPDTAELVAAEQLIQQRQPLIGLSQFQPFYTALAAAIRLALASGRYLRLSEGGQVLSASAHFEAYQELGYAVDQAYRHYWQAALPLSDSALLQSLHGKVEQLYRDVLHWQAEHWDACLLEAGVWPIPALAQQTDFFEKQVWLKSNRGEQRTVVIISDAMRYEVAQELQSRLAEQMSGNNQLEALAGVLPSRTHFGMSALLPRTSQQPLRLDAELRIEIDGQRPENAESRSKLLAAAGQARGNKAITALRYSELLSLKREAGRELAKSFQIAYIYHDQIDATGDKHGNQDQVFAACDHTVSELLALIKRLVNWGVSQVLVTADHGFIYQQESQGEHDKIDLPEDSLFSKRRCALATHSVETPGVLSLRLTHYAQPYPDLYALVPRGVQRFRKQGGSTKYAHGGATLQEICVPVLSYQHIKASVDKTRPKTGVRVLATQKRITNNVFALSLLQEQPVNEAYRGRELQIFFEDPAGKRVSNAPRVVFDSPAQHAPEREQRVSLTLATSENKLKLRLRIVDSDGYDAIAPEDWDLDLSFSNEFGF